MQQDKSRIKEQLEDELESLQFMGDKEVLQRVKRKTFRQKLSDIWNKEVEIPLVPAGIAIAVFLSLGVIDLMPENQSDTGMKERELVESGGNTYWKDELERVEAKNED